MVSIWNFELESVKIFVVIEIVSLKKYFTSKTIYCHPSFLFTTCVALNDTISFPCAKLASLRLTHGLGVSFRLPELYS